MLAGTVLAGGVAIYLNAWLTAELGARQWQVPARVFARPLVLYPGQPLTADELRRELALLGYRQAVGRAEHPGEAVFNGERVEIHARPFAFSDGHRGSRRWTLEFAGRQLRQLRDDSGQALDLARLDPVALGSIYTSHREDRVLVRLEEVPPLLLDTLLLVEDRDFWRHWGLSLKGIARAAAVNLRAGRTVQGGSTLTQQLVKNALLSRHRSWHRKLLEALLAPLVELHHDKAEILEAYVNEIYLGQEGSRAIHGFALASRHYFNQPLGELSPGQIALLVGLVKGPSLYDPWRAPERARQRRDTVLALMAEHGLVPEQAARSARSAGLGLAKADAAASMYPAYLDLVRRQLRQDYREEDLQTQGLRIFTSFDPRIQRSAEQSLATVMDQLDAGRRRELEAAVVVTDAVSGDIVAVVGGRRMRYAGFNRALDAVRPIGSLVKPVVYLAALAQPERYTLVTPLSDAPVVVRGRDGSEWRPRNFDRESHGEVPLHRALAQSYNQATARLGMEVGLDRVLAMARALGVERDWPSLPSLTLGAAGLTPLEVATLYQAIASHGVHSPPRAIEAVTAADGTPLARYPRTRRQTVEASTVHLLHYALQEVVREGTGRGVYRYLPGDYRVAGKTGTTDDLRDSWFAGFGGDYLAVVWLGRDDNGSSGLTGSSGALRVWGELMGRIGRVPLDPAPPEGVNWLWVDGQGLRSAEHCADARYLPFAVGSEPTEVGGCQLGPGRLWQWFRGLFD